MPDFDWLQTVVPKGLEREGLYHREPKTRETGSRGASTRQEDGSARGGRSTGKGPEAHGGQQEGDQERITFPEQLWVLERQERTCMKVTLLSRSAAVAGGEPLLPIPRSPYLNNHLQLE